MLNTHAEDPCCGKGISRALRDGKLDTADHWICPRCGERWEAEIVSEIRHWTIRPLIALLRV